MIGFITGTVVDVSENCILLECGGIGYEVNVSAYTVHDKGKTGENVRIYTYLAVKEDGISLYGFYSPAEKAMFMRLISISGIGPKLAISILSGISLDALSLAISTGDAKSLSKIKGVGKKTAERIALELKDKVMAEIGETDFVAAAPADNDAVIALMSMGFSKQEAAAALGKVNTEGLTVEQIVLAALKRS